MTQLVLAGLPINQINRLQSILHAAARLVLRLPGRASVTDRIRDDLHWLDVSKCITFKHCVLAFKCQTGLTQRHRVCRRRPCRVVSASDLQARTPCSFHEQEQKRLGREDFPTPAQLHGTISPVLSDSWTNRCPFSRKT